MPSACSRYAAPKPAIPVPRTTTFGLGMKVQSPYVLASHRQRRPREPLNRLGGFDLFRIPAECLVTLDLGQCRGPKIALLFEGAIPFDDPTKSLLQGKNRLPIEQGLGFRSIQLQKTGFARMAQGILHPGGTVAPRSRQFVGNPANRLGIGVNRAKIPA